MGTVPVLSGSRIGRFGPASALLRSLFLAVEITGNPEELSLFSMGEVPAPHAPASPKCFDGLLVKPLAF